MDSLDTGSEGFRVLLAFGKGHTCQLPLYKDSKAYSCGALLYTHSSLYLLLPGYNAS